MSPRRGVLEQLRNGEIEPEEARSRLRELTRTTREAIRDHLENAGIREAICDCRETLFDSVRDARSQCGA